LAGSSVRKRPQLAGSTPAWFQAVRARIAAMATGFESRLVAGNVT
jgi:hypothetical protein